MKLTFLGTGTSHGVPVIACDCPVCCSENPKDKRNRSSVYIQTNDDKFILIDIGPEFRIQAVKYGVKKVDCLLLTHSHADHLHGIDDLRIFSCDSHFRTEKNAAIIDAPPIPIYANQATIDDVNARFSYFFKHAKEGGGHAKVDLQKPEGTFVFGATEITPIPMMHGHLETVGWLLTETVDGKRQSIAYLTDCSFISDESIALIREKCGTLKHLVIDGLRIQPHSTHFSYLEAMAAAEKIGGEKVWFTHLTHHHFHTETEDYIKEHIAEFPKLSRDLQPAWDGLVIEC